LKHIGVGFYHFIAYPQIYGVDKNCKLLWLHFIMVTIVHLYFGSY